MKSYILAIVTTMFLSALFAFQNIGDVTVRFLIFEWTFPQGVWEVLLFCSGAAIMWIFSIFSMFETRGKYKRQLKAKDELILAAEKDKKAIIDSMATAARIPEPATHTEMPAEHNAQLEKQQQGSDGTAEKTW
jgi:uncharacterized integral membrane protein